MRLFITPTNDSHWHNVFKYEPLTGYLVNRYSRNYNSKAGAVSGSVNACDGYVVVGFHRKLYKAHRVIWEMVNGHIPDGMEIDHINGVRSDNRLVNLRLVTDSGNMRNKKRHSNNTSGYAGVSWHKKSGKYSARIWGCGVRKNLGLFNTAEEAHQAYLTAAGELGYHKNHGRG